MAIGRNENENLKIVIYVLIDPIDNNVRYVGWTSKLVFYRLREHINESKRMKKTHKCNWIRSLLNKNMEPKIRIIEETNYSMRKEKESYWIKYYGRENLTNNTNGGDGSSGHIVSKERKEQLSLKMSGSGNPIFGTKRSEITKQRMSENKIGRQINRHKPNPTSNYFGVFWNSQKKKWNAKMCHMKKQIHIGFYKIEDDAARAYDAKCYELYGSQAKLNFPEEWDL